MPIFGHSPENPYNIWEIPYKVGKHENVDSLLKNAPMDFIFGPNVDIN